MAQARLPSEILSEIFEHCVVGTKRSPWSLGGICGRWRLVVLGTPRLWSHITLRLQRTRNESQNELLQAEEPGGRIICRDLEALERTLERAKNTLLDVHIVGTLDAFTGWRNFYLHQRQHAAEPTKLDNQKPTMYQQMIRSIGGQRMARWRSLNLEIYGEAGWGDYFFGVASLESLESLKVIGYCPSLFGLVARTSRRLNYLGVTDLHNITNSDIQWLENIETFCFLTPFCWKGYPEFRLGLSEYQTVLSSIKDMKQLRIALRNDVSQPSRPIPCTLQKLDLVSSLQDWTPFIAGSAQTLTHLCIHQDAQEIIITQGVITLPKLTFLRVEEPNAFEGLQILHCPVLVRLEYRASWNKTRNERAFVQLIQYLENHTSPHPFLARQLLLESLECSYKLLYKFLLLIPTCEELSIRCSGLPKSFFTFFSHSTITDHGSRRFDLLPALKRALFDTNFAPYTGPKLKPRTSESILALKGAIKKRQLNGSPLQSVVVRRSKDGATKEFKELVV